MFLGQARIPKVSWGSAPAWMDPLARQVENSPLGLAFAGLLKYNASRQDKRLGALWICSLEVPCN